MYNRIINAGNDDKKPIEYEFTGGGEPKSGLLTFEAAEDWPAGYTDVSYGHREQKIWSTVGVNYGDGTLDISTPL